MFDMPTFAERYAAHISPEIKALAERGNITLDEWKSLRCNSYEFEIIKPKLTDEALLYVGQHLIDNCCFDRRRPWRSYNEDVMGWLAPELLKRLRERVERGDHAVEARE